MFSIPVHKNNGAEPCLPGQNLPAKMPDNPKPVGPVESVERHKAAIEMPETAKKYPFDKKEIDALHKKIRQKDNISDAEKRYAIRFFDFLIETDDFTSLRDQIETIKASNYGTDLDSFWYKKWGLGKQESFSYPEQIYIFFLDYMAQGWEAYNQIDLDNLRPAEQAHLQNTKAALAGKEINIEDEIKNALAGKSEFDIAFLRAVKVLSEQKTITDKDIVFQIRYFSQAGDSGFMPLNDSNDANSQ